MSDPVDNAAGSAFRVTVIPPSKARKPKKEPEPKPATVASVVVDPQLGRQLGNLRLVERIGSGGMGDVYKAEHQALKSFFAVKVLHPRFSQDPDTVERFRREALACAKLRNEHVVFVTDFGFDPAVGIFIAMEHLDGFNLKQILRARGPFSVGRMVRVGVQVCEALAAAHRVGITHRDIKPENIMLLSEPGRRDFVKVLDFGIAFMKDRDWTRDPAQDGVVLGTPAFMAPEQVVNQPELIGPHTDIYGMGLVFYTMLAGAPPFGGKDELAVLTRQVNEPAPLIGQVLPVLSGTKLETLLASMLMKAIAARPRSAGEVALGLEQAVAELEERGVDGARYNLPREQADEPDDTTLITGKVSNTSALRTTRLLRRIEALRPDSTAAALLSAMRDLDGVRGEALALALWGVLQADLLEAEPNGDALRVAADQTALLLQAVLEGGEGGELNEVQKRVFRAVNAGIGLLAPAQRVGLEASLRPLAAHANFPMELLSADYAGQWKGVSGLRARSDRAGAARDEDLSRMSLMEKLRQDVSLKVLGSVLSHEIKLRKEVP